ncbi:MAG: hypothetical protein EU547_03840 [Promethearchaeota archaeon]|nr:MAG: hypothetical protein EU547_03840 [Candidatus Lokiarchaeota archaeon]
MTRIKKNLIILSLVIIFFMGVFVSSFEINPNSITPSNLSARNDINVAQNGKLAVIHIDDNWSDTSYGPPGGPYIIEDEIIDATGYDVGILIENSAMVNFEIRNCTIFGAEIGIKFYNVIGGVISNLTILNITGEDSTEGNNGGNGVGILLLDTSMIMLNNVTIYNIEGGRGDDGLATYDNGGDGGDGIGVSMINSGGIQLNNNIMDSITGGRGGSGNSSGSGGSGGLGMGIYIQSSISGSTILYNNITNIEGGTGGGGDFIGSGGSGGLGTGIYFNSTTDNTIEKNTLNGITGGAGGMGGLSYGPDGNDGKSYGFYLDSESYENEISIDNTLEGEPIIFLYNKNNIQIENLSLTEHINPTNLGKMVFIECSNIDLKNNTIANMTANTGSTGKFQNAGKNGESINGIYVSHCDHVSFYNNTIEDIFGGDGGNGGYQGRGGIGGNSTGIFLWTTYYIELDNNTIRNIIGGDGGNGGVSGDGGNGGVARGIHLRASGIIDASNNTLREISGGSGGSAGWAGDSAGMNGNEYTYFINNVWLTSSNGGKGIYISAYDISGAVGHTKISNYDSSDTSIPLLIEDSSFKNYDYGIHLENVSNAEIKNVECIENDGHTGYGIYLKNSDNNRISESNVSLNKYGIYLQNSEKNNITENIFSNNWELYHSYGVSLIDSADNIIIDNSISGKEYTSISVNGSNNQIYSNYFYSTDEIYAYDNGTGNEWNTTVGNYWSDYSGEDSNNDGIGDQPYNISGSAESKDYRPIWDDGPTIIINSPGEDDVFGSDAPSYEIHVYSNLEVNNTWYSLGDGQNITCGSTGTINQTAWNEIEDGGVFITFYANNSGGALNSKSIGIYKDTEGINITIISPSSGSEFGSNAPSYEISLESSYVTIVSLNYSVEGGQKIPCSTSGYIQQSEWELLPDGEITITFYTEDNLGRVNSSSVNVTKNTSSAGGGSGDNIPGFLILITIPTTFLTVIVVVYLSKYRITLS